MNPFIPVAFIVIVTVLTSILIGRKRRLSQRKTVHFRRPRAVCKSRLQLGKQVICIPKDSMPPISGWVFRLEGPWYYFASTKLTGKHQLWDLVKKGIRYIEIAHSTLGSLILHFDENIVRLGFPTWQGTPLELYYEIVTVDEASFWEVYMRRNRFRGRTKRSAYSRIVEIIKELKSIGTHSSTVRTLKAARELVNGPEIKLV